MASDLNSKIEEVLRDLPPAGRFQTGQVAERVRKLGVTNGDVYKRLLALAPRCPCARQDRSSAFVRFHRTCYPWVWAKLPPGQPLQAEAKPSPTPPPGAVVELSDGQLERLAQRVACLLREGDNLTLATLGDQSEDPEECINCGFPGLNYDNGICPDCVRDLAGTEEV